MRASRLGFNPYRYFQRTPPPNIPRAEVPAPPALGMEDPRFTIKKPSVQCLPNPVHIEVSERRGVCVPIPVRMPLRERGFLLAYLTERQR